ncbi:MAG: DEAD/DEAH box helicase, partial [Halobacteriaceae archaeon]
MASQVSDVGTLFLHERGDDYEVVVTRDGDRVFRAALELKSTEAGPRPGKFRVLDDAGGDHRSPEEFVEIARRASRIRISEQTSPAGRTALQEMLDGYQLEAAVVRTCRYCADGGRYSPITEETAITAGDEDVCPDCAVEELERELAFRGDVTGGAKDRLEDLLLEVRDLDRVVNLLSGELDPELTKFDEISATTDDPAAVPVEELQLHPGVK